MGDFYNNARASAISTITSSSLYLSFSKWHQELADRDKIIVHLLAIAFASTLVFSWLWKPISESAIATGVIVHIILPYINTHKDLNM